MKTTTAKTIIDNSGKAHRVPEMWETRTRVSRGNAKTCIPSINLLAGDATAVYSGNVPGCCKGLNDTPGTCNGGTCPGCYALKITRNIGAYLMYITNTQEAIADPARFVAMVEKELFNGDILNAPRVVRIHDSGDFFNLDYFTAIVEMIKRHPETRFGAYTKSADIVIAYGLDNLPDNFTLSCSPWPGHCDAIGDLPQFIFDAGDDPEIAALPHCPAVDKNGHRTGITCNKCLHCYRAKRGDRWAVYPH